MNIEILDASGHVLTMIPNVTNPEYNFQFVWKKLIPGAHDWRGYVPPAPTTAELLLDLRTKRNKLLADTDWTQMVDSPLTEEQRTKWRAYRQALRDMPETSLDLLSPSWPTINI